MVVYGCLWWCCFSCWLSLSDVHVRLSTGMHSNSNGKQCKFQANSDSDWQTRHLSWAWLAYFILFISWCQHAQLALFKLDAFLKRCLCNTTFDSSMSSVRVNNESAAAKSFWIKTDVILTWKKLTGRKTKYCWNVLTLEEGKISLQWRKRLKGDSLCLHWNWILSYWPRKQLLLNHLPAEGGVGNKSSTRSLFPLCAASLGKAALLCAQDLGNILCLVPEVKIQHESEAQQLFLRTKDKGIYTLSFCTLLHELFQEDSNKKFYVFSTSLTRIASSDILGEEKRREIPQLRSVLR